MGNRTSATSPFGNPAEAAYFRKLNTAGSDMQAHDALGRKRQQTARNQARKEFKKLVHEHRMAQGQRKTPAPE